MRAIRRSSLIVPLIALSIFTTGNVGFAANSSPYDLPSDVTLGKPRVWGYQRVYPLLDGLFQDVASTQLSSLTLNPNAPNASNLNAIQNAFQLGVSFSQTTGATNAVAQQLNSTLGSSAALQGQLLTLQSQLVQSSLAAQQQVTTAQDLVDQLNNSTTATADDKASAASALKTAQDNLTLTTNQLNLVKSQLSTSFGSLQTLTAPSTSGQQNAPTLPTALLGLTAPPGAPTSPSFPSSKQMDNQINLLWERISRLVSTLAQPDSMDGYQLALVEMNVGLTPLKRKDQLFGVEYELGCSTGGAAGTGTVVALDMFPSASAVNIVDTKYRENRIGLAAFLSFFSVGINAAYNRDHLQMSQALGQSAYITGFGIGSNKFGWMFGSNLGDNTITPGSRTTFALVAAKGCKTISLTAKRAEWFKKGCDNWHSSSTRSLKPTVFDYDVASGKETTAGTQSAVTPNSIKSLRFVPTDYDPTGSTKSLVSVAVETSQPIDQQQIISVSGRILKRSRDNFGRGVGSGGAGGLLETASLEPNSWLPTSSTSFTLTLDPAGFGRHFPDIQIAAPSGTFSLNEQLKPGGAKVYVSGHEFTCSASCPSDLPALGYAKPTVKQLLASQWHKNGAGENDSLFITLWGDQQQNSLTPGGNGGVPTLQVLSSGDQPSWGGDTVVLATIDDKMYRLACKPSGSRMICEPPVIASKPKPFDDAFTVEVSDPDHVGGGTKAWLSVDKCDGAGVPCRPPLVWQLAAPHWQTNKKGDLEIVLHLELINVDASTTINLFGGPSNTVLVSSGTCPALQKNICAIDLLLPESKLSNVTDAMVLQFGGSSAPTAGLRYLRSNAQPVLTGINDKQTVMTGQNLFFKSIRVGDSGSVLLLDHASDGSECRVISPYPPKADGYLSFLAQNDVPLPVILIKGTTATQVHHDATSKPDAKAGGAKPQNKEGQVSNTTNPKDFGKGLQLLQ